MPRPTQSQILDFVDVQHTYQWEVRIINSPEVVTIEPDRWNFQCLSHELPVKTVESSELQTRGTYY